ncbi:hypothetical protein [Streptomyces bambusae]|uniref:Uncharacterized protein n=1 Tax=Streptomyces bambusae TaxID=1550616 RepID=A0ABS6Z630_9ACTN|nr:hypothetical protein [Streptomyces bambusae]MBW5482166.1 hypothetical protein [Streptomyces bambusae]
MIITFLIFLAVGLVLAVTPGALLGCVYIAVSGRLSRRPRVVLLFALAAGSSALWVPVVGTTLIWWPTVVGISFAGTLVSGFTLLGREARRRSARLLPPPVWPGWTAPADRG